MDKVETWEDKEVNLGDKVALEDRVDMAKVGLADKDSEVREDLEDKVDREDSEVKVSMAKADTEDRDGRGSLEIPTTNQMKM